MRHSTPRVELRFAAQTATCCLALSFAITAGPRGSVTASGGRFLSTQLLDRTDQDYYANARPYLEESTQQLLAEIPELEGVQPATDQHILPLILSSTGQSVEAFFADIVSVLAREHIEEQKLDSKGRVIASHKVQYDYLISTDRDQLPPQVQEYRVIQAEIRQSQRVSRMDTLLPPDSP
jgi:hypothetical protein